MQYRSQMIVYIIAISCSNHEKSDASELFQLKWEKMQKRSHIFLLKCDPVHELSRMSEDKLITSFPIQSRNMLERNHISVYIMIISLYNSCKSKFKRETVWDECRNLYNMSIISDTNTIIHKKIFLI